MLSDLTIILFWWLTIFGIGFIFLPFTRKIFSRFFDQGYLLAKVIGILFSSYLVWLLGSLKLLPFVSSTIWWVLLAGLILNLFLISKNRFLITANRQLGIVWVGEELMFLLTLTAWAFIRGFQPDIEGLEKFMDFGFMNSILRSQYFPPADMWFAGKPINYYYFGHFVAAFLTKLTRLDSAITYNLMLATLFAFTFSLSFSLTSNLIYSFEIEKSKYKNLKSIILAGLISALLLSLGANLHPIYYELQMKVFKLPYCDGTLSYWYPNATRYIGYCPNVDDKTIHEFPSYSFIVSDLHGHVSDIPFVLLFLSLAFNLLLVLKKAKKSALNFELLVFSFLPLALTLAVMFMTNQWDFPIYFLVLGLILLVFSSAFYGFSWLALEQLILNGGTTLLLAIPFLLPFQLKFEATMVKGVALVHAHSLFFQLLILWGGPWFFGLVYSLFLFKEQGKNWGKTLQDKLHHLLKLSAADLFVLILLLTATILIIIPEIIYLKDIYISSYHRANTMFKLTYQSFIMYGLAIGFIFSRVLNSLKKSRFKFLVTLLFALVFSALMIYPNYSIPGYYGQIKKENYRGLYGLNFLKREFPGDFAAVGWLKEKVQGQPVILEAVGDSYTDYGRISMATGLPTIQGWLVHEWLWRGSYDEPGARASEVQTIYESKDLLQTKKLLEKYQVKYIIVGELERKKYPNLNEKKIKSLGEKVFESGKTYIIKVSNIAPETKSLSSKNSETFKTK